MTLANIVENEGLDGKFYCRSGPSFSKTICGRASEESNNANKIKHSPERQRVREKERS